MAGAEKNYHEFLTILNGFHNEQEYFAYYNDLKDKIINFIKTSEAYQAMQKDESVLNPVKLPETYGQHNIYKDTNVGKRFISIDMKKTNFSALVHYGKTHDKTFFPSYTWNEFIAQFTDIPYFAESKYIRQVVFGNCNPKRQIAYEKKLISELLATLLKHGEKEGNLFPDDVESLCCDEIILKGNAFQSKTLFDWLKKTATENADFPIKIEPFELQKIEGTKAYVKRCQTDIGIVDEPKCVNPLEMPFVYRKLYERDITDNDLYFHHEGKLAKFVITGEWIPHEEYCEAHNYACSDKMAFNCPTCGNMSPTKSNYCSHCGTRFNLI